MGRLIVLVLAYQVWSAAAIRSAGFEPIDDVLMEPSAVSIHPGPSQSTEKRQQTWPERSAAHDGRLQEMASLAGGIYVFQEIVGDWKLVKDWDINDISLKGGDHNVGIYKQSAPDGDRTCVLAFSGRQSLVDAVVDSLSTSVTWCGFKEVQKVMASHASAFLTGIRFNEFERFLANPSECGAGISVVGHGLGGAMAELLAACANTPEMTFFNVSEVYTFGAPGISKAPLKNLTASDGCFKGARVFNEDAMIVDAMVRRVSSYLHPKLNAVRIAEAGKGEYKRNDVDCSDGRVHELPQRGKIPNVPIHRIANYYKRLSPNGEAILKVVTRERSASLFNLPEVVRKELQVAGAPQGAWQFLTGVTASISRASTNFQKVVRKRFATDMDKWLNRSDATDPWLFEMSALALHIYNLSSPVLGWVLEKSWNVDHLASNSVDHVGIYRKRSPVQAPEASGDSEKPRWTCALTFSGTDDLADFLTDIDVWTRSWCGFPWVHQGFAGHIGNFMTGIRYPEFRNYLRDTNNCDEIITVGHSLGGAIAELITACAYAEGSNETHLFPISATYTFGAPSIAKHQIVNRSAPDGCLKGVRSYTEDTYSVDPVAIALFPFGFSHPKMAATRLYRRPQVGDAEHTGTFARADSDCVHPRTASHPRPGKFPAPSMHMMDTYFARLGGRFGTTFAPVDEERAIEARTFVSDMAIESAPAAAA